MQALSFPVPCFRVDADYNILQASGAAYELFPQAARFSELVDVGSASKALSLITPAHGGVKLELNLITISRPCAMFEVYQQWDKDGIGHLVCIERQYGLDVAAARLLQLHDTLIGSSFPENNDASGLVKLEYASSSRDAEIRGSLEAIKDLVQLLQPALLELGKTEYADLITHQADTALEQLAPIPVRKRA